MVRGACAKASGGRRAFSTVALANHGPPTNHWEIVDGIGYNVSSGQRDDGINELFEVLAGSAIDRVDLLACSLAKTKAGVKLIDELERKYQMNFAASDDVTGNPAAGGDWVLETDNIDVKEVYFDMSLLHEFDGTFALAAKRK